MGKKSTKTAKQPVRLREKSIKGGGKSLYLDVYSNGKRQYEFLKLYLIAERTEADRVLNAAIRKQAQAVQAQRIIEVNTNSYGFGTASIKTNINLIDYINAIVERKQRSGNKGNYKTSFNYTALARHLEQYKGRNITFKDINTAFCNGFLEYLRTARDNRCRFSGNVLGANAQFENMRRFGYILNTAVSDEIIFINPLNKVKQELKPKKRQAEVCYLTINEVKSLESVPFSLSIKQPFLFSCYTGLRFSDIAGLTWNKLQKDNNGNTLITYEQQKTKKQEYLPLPRKALNLLPDRNGANDTDNVFDLPSNTYVNLRLKEWAALAGLKKCLTFHVARHTAATLLLSLGTSIETVSKILGHSDIKTTQIYAKVTAQAQKEAMNKFDTL